jgi:hypothetical protein
LFSWAWWRRLASWNTKPGDESLTISGEKNEIEGSQAPEEPQRVPYQQVKDKPKRDSELVHTVAPA